MNTPRSATLASLVVALGVLALAHAAEPPKPDAAPRNGYVPNAETAISIAVAVWSPIYGSDNIARQRPYRATLGQNGIWVVTGSLPKGWVGGTARAEIARSDGRIVSVSHGK